MYRFLVIAALAALIAVAGCGGGDSGDEGSDANVPVAAPGADSGPPGSKKAYIAQADVTCSELNAKIQKLPQPKEPKDLGPLYRNVAREAEDFYAKFRAIPKPRKDRRTLARYEANLRKNIDLTRRVAVVVEENRTNALSPLVKRVQSLQKRNRRIAERYGFRICGGV